MDYRDKIVYILDSNQSTYAKIYNRSGELISKFITKDVDGMKTKLLEFFDLWDDGRYKLELKTSETSPAHSTITQWIEKATDTELPPMESAPINGYRIEEVEELVSKRVAEERERIQFETMKSEVEATQKELETNAGKLATICSIFLNKLINGYMNGQSSLSINGVPQQTEQTSESPSNVQEQYQEAFHLLTQHVDAPTLLAFAHKIASDPSVVNTLKAFL